MSRSTIAGIYGADFWKKLFALLLLIIPPLTLALDPQRIFEKGINWVKNAVEEMKVMVTT